MEGCDDTLITRSADLLGCMDVPCVVEVDVIGLVVVVIFVDVLELDSEKGKHEQFETRLVQSAMNNGEILRDSITGLLATTIFITATGIVSVA